MLDKFLFGNKHIPEMYFGNIPVAKIYFGTTLIWEKEGYVPYDDTCTATVTLSQDKMAWIVTITKNGEDVTSSLSQMITWIYNGKGERVDPQYAYSNTIDLSQFPRGDYRLDLSRITSKAGGYFPGSGALSFSDHIYIGQLVAGSQNVAIEYVPESDIAVTDIGIFTSQNNSGNPHIKIFHESGLCVAAVDGDTITTGQEIYWLSGSKHDTVISSTTLYAGQKYYVVYSNGYAQFYPAYFNESGNYKEYENEETASQTTIADVSPNASTFKTTKYKGLITSLDAALGYSQNDWFTWVGSSSTLNSGHVYQRTETGTTYAYGGSVGDADNHHTITNDDLMTIINMELNSQFWWYINDYGGMTKGDIYAKVSGTWQSSTLVDISQYNDESQKTAAILVALQNNANSAMVGGQTTLWYNNRIGYIMKLKSGYTSKVTDASSPLTSLPSNPSSGEIYYLAGSIGQEVGYQTACFAYTGSSWTQINQNNYTNYLDETPLSNLLTRIGSKSDLFSDVDNGTYNLVTATVKNRKYYLKINGKEA